MGRYPRTEALFVEAWAEHGFEAARLVLGPGTTAQDVCMTADVVWVDAASIKMHAALRDLLKPPQMCAPSPARSDRTTSGPVPLLCIAHTSADELLALEPELSAARNVLLVKRPTELHRVVELIDANGGVGRRDWREWRDKLAGAPCLRLATRAQEDEERQRREAQQPPEPVLKKKKSAVQEAEFAGDGKKRKVLLIEDNMVRVRHVRA